MSIICINNADTRRRLKPRPRFRKKPKPLIRHVATQAGRPLCGKWKYKKNAIFQDDLDQPNCPLCLAVLEKLKPSAANS